jgi:hypothetical protein
VSASKGVPSWRAMDLTGHKYNKLTVLRQMPNRGERRCWLCRCDCGTEKSLTASDLRSGRVVSCGCHKRAQMAQRNRDGATHGMTHTGVYRSWFAMRDRCENPKSPSWQWYGGRGVRVCDRWQAFERFFEDIGHRPAGKTLDRLNPFGDYEPTNCRWATPKEQAANKRGAGGNNAA